MAPVLRLIFPLGVVLAAALNLTHHPAYQTLAADSIAAVSPFSCYINGQPWWPAGNVNGAPDLVATFDPAYNNGSLEIAAHRVIDQSKEYIYLRVDSVWSKTIDIKPTSATVRLTIQTGMCGTATDERAYDGNVQLVSVSMAERKVAGVFACDVVADCGVLRLTAGRFEVNF